MANSDEKPEQTPTPLPEVTVPVAPVMVGGVEEYGSSEEFQRANAAALTKKKEDEQNRKLLTDRQRIHAVLNKYIEKHNTVKAVRARIKENGQSVNKHTLEIQFEVSDAIAAELTKIKNELR